MKKFLPFLVFSLLLVSCYQYKELERRVEEPEIAFKDPSIDSAFVKFHLRNGWLILADSWEERGKSLLVEGKEFDEYRKLREVGEFEIPIDSIALVETNRYKGFMTNGQWILTFTLIYYAYQFVWCQANPKACYGSCPTFYVFDGGKPILQAEGFSSSIARAFQKRDIDMLPSATPKDTFLILGLNEALETQVIKDVELVSVKKDKDERVFLSPEEDVFFRVKGMRGVDEFVTQSGDQSTLVNRWDRLEYRSWADPDDLTRPETLRIRFKVRKAGRKGLVIVYRQTLMTTFLFYQTLAYMGKRYGDVFAEIERERPPIEDQLGVISKFSVIFKGRKVAEIKEAGPIAQNACVVDLGYLGYGSYELEIVLTKGLWKLDYLALCDIVGYGRPEYLRPAKVKTTGLLGEDFPIVLLPGDSLLLEFYLRDKDVELFLLSEGYYYEWMRKEWLEEEDPKMLFLLTYFPKIYFRILAPKYKEVEREMERKFWNSKFEGRLSS